MVKNVVAYGGTITPVNQLQRGCNILVASPDMLLDLVSKRKVSFSNCRYLVLDKANRMWDGMEFMSEIKNLFEDPNLPWGERQTLIFAETFPDEMQESAQQFMAEDYLFLCDLRISSSCESDSDSDWGCDRATIQMKASDTAVEGNGHNASTSDISNEKKNGHDEAMVMVKHLEARVDELQMKEIELELKGIELERRCLKAQEEKGRIVNQLSDEMKVLNNKMSGMQKDLLAMVEHCLNFEKALSQTKEENLRMEKKQTLGKKMSNEGANRNEKSTVEEVSDLRAPGVSSNWIGTSSSGSLGSTSSSSMPSSSVLDLPQVQPPNPIPTKIMWHHPTSVPVYTPGQPRLPVYHQGQSNQHRAPVGIDVMAQYLGGESLQCL